MAVFRKVFFYDLKLQQRVALFVKERVLRNSKYEMGAPFLIVLKIIIIFFRRP